MIWNLSICIRLFSVQVLTAIAVPLVFRQGGTRNDGLYRKLLATTTPAPTTVPPAFLANLAFREANLQEQIDRARRTLQEGEWRLGNLTASMGRANASLKVITNTVSYDNTLMNGTKSIITNLVTHYSRNILEGKYNQTQALLKSINATAQNISQVFGAAKGQAASTKDVNKTIADLEVTILLNGTAVNEVLTNFSKMEEVLSHNVSEYVKWRVNRDGEDVFRHISAKFEDLLNNQTNALKAGRLCDLVPNITECNKTNATSATTFLQAPQPQLHERHMLSSYGTGRPLF
eukprot:gnl/MRDRNA2_/MRDRNA2_100052_c0_seq1.p1 gnl/MRDRNA2_/MRDRNA2_100052_c0~~gnl/MRDRNA2_/MRDRNA2_100052_c0_seq1.p1  ORF type:complete len:290 (+),score=39.24 gnl/MRDRNA2_/MRDRNA2_100052_c0_seq1:92-961(+)